MDCSCNCCSAFRPRYKRLVNNIYPANPADGYDKSNLEKLTFYARAQSEKLDRIGDYLAQRIARDLYRQRPEYVAIGVEAMDKLLITSNSQSLNLFVESFLRVVQQLLNSQDVNMQLLGTQSFVKFASIEEDTPSYHRRYDFFVSKFSSMAHSSVPDIEKRRRIRVAGLNGLRGIIRKNVSNDLQANIWNETHMDKIVPSLLFNIQSQNDQNDGEQRELQPPQQQITTKLYSNSIVTTIVETPLIAVTTFGDKADPVVIAEDCLKELVRRGYPIGRHEVNMNEASGKTLRGDEVNSTTSSPEIVKDSSDEDAANFEMFKRVLEEEPEEPEDEKRVRIIDWFRTATFEELIEKAKSAKCLSGNYYTLGLEIAAKCIV